MEEDSKQDQPEVVDPRQDARSSTSDSEDDDVSDIANEAELSRIRNLVRQNGIK